MSNLILFETLKFSEEEFEAIEKLSGCNYPPEKIALYLQVDEKLFMDLYQDIKSDVRRHYDRGKLVADFEVNSKQQELAMAGNITAAQIYLKEKEKNEIENIRKKCLYNE